MRRVRCPVDQGKKAPERRVLHAAHTLPHSAPWASCSSPTFSTSRSGDVEFLRELYPLTADHFIPAIPSWYAFPTCSLVKVAQSRPHLFATPWTIQSMEFSREE